MPLDPSHVGHEYPPSQPYLVTREKIREFAEAIGASHPAYVDVAAARALGHPDVVAPPTFPMVLTADGNRAMIDDPRLGLDFSRVVHGDQRFSYARPVHAGDLLRTTATIEDITSRAGNAFLTNRFDVRDAAGEPVVTVRSMLVVRGE
jgi:acyl dehydratase